MSTSYVPSSRRVGVSLVWLLLSAAAANAQPTASVSVGGSFDAFQPVAAGAESRRNVLGGLSAEHLFSGERGRVYYDLDAGNYDSPGDWRYFQHHAGVTWRIGSGDAAASKLFVNGSLVKRSNGDAWVNAAYTAAGAGVNAEFHPREATTVRAGYRADYRRFADLDALTQMEHRGFASLLVNLPSKTTLVAEAQAGAKQYHGTLVAEVFDAGTPAAVTGRGAGPGMGPGVRWASGPAYVASTRNGTAGLVTALGRIAQSLADRTGVHAQVQVRRTFASVPPALVTTPAGFFEDGVYDDPFASDAVIVQAGLKHVFRNSADVAATAWWAGKDYTSAMAIGGDGAETSLRADRVAIGSLTWSQPLFASRTGSVGMSADVGYRFMRHRSNDTYYNYTSHGATVGVTIEY